MILERLTDVIITYIKRNVIVVVGIVVGFGVGIDKQLLNAEAINSYFDRLVRVLRRTT